MKPLGTERLHGAGRHVVSDFRNSGANAHVEQRHRCRPSTAV